MIVQSTDLARVKRLMITRANNVSSLMNLKIEVSGEHLITVFSIRRGSRMAYTHTPYQTRMMIDIPVTTFTLLSK